MGALKGSTVVLIIPYIDFRLECTGASPQRAKHRFIFTSILQRPVTQPEVLLDRVRQIHEQTFALRPVVVVSHINSCQKSRVRGHTKVLEP